MKKTVTALLVTVLALVASPAVLAHKAGTDQSPDTLNMSNSAQQKANHDLLQADQDRAASDASGNATESYLLEQKADQQQKKADQMEDAAQGERNLSDDLDTDK